MKLNEELHTMCHPGLKPYTVQALASVNCCWLVRGCQALQTKTLHPLTQPCFILHGRLLPRLSGYFLIGYECNNSFKIYFSKFITFHETALFHCTSGETTDKCNMQKGSVIVMNPQEITTWLCDSFQCWELLYSIYYLIVLLWFCLVQTHHSHQQQFQVKKKTTKIINQYRFNCITVIQCNEDVWKEYCKTSLKHTVVQMNRQNVPIDYSPQFPDRYFSTFPSGSLNTHINITGEM